MGSLEVVCPGFRGVVWLGSDAAVLKEESMGKRGYPPEFRRRVLDLVEATPVEFEAAYQPTTAA